jgi:hypothetical protein
MKSMFDVYFGGNLSSRAAMQEKIRNLQTEGSVIQETIQAVESRTPAQQVSDLEEVKRLNKEKRNQLISAQSSGAKYLGDAFVLYKLEQN